jgi:protein-glutamine gamma-glutamyltransferase
LPLVMLIGVLFSYYIVDKLQLIVLPRAGAYFAMLAGAFIAIGEFYDVLRTGAALNAVANLLVYVQVGLITQKKERRVFEHWGIFLLLEMIVAALVNDNLLYGLLLIPILMVGCSCLLAFSAYVSNQKSGSSGAESNSVFSRFLKWLGQDRDLSPVNNSIQMQYALATTNQPANVAKFGVRRALGLTINIILFAAAFFYFMPRLSSESYEGSGWSQPVVGYSGQVSLEQIGALLENNSVALKLKFFDVKNGRQFQPVEPPYIRGSVCQVYLGEGVWENLHRGGGHAGLSVLTPNTGAVSETLDQETDNIEITVEEQTVFQDATFNIPPLSKSTGRSNSPRSLIASDWTFLDSRNEYGKEFKQVKIHGKSRLHIST